MQINSINLNFSPNFASKNKNIKLADDVMRKSKLAFPYIGNTYISKFYGSVKHQSSNYYPDAKRLGYVIYNRTLSFRNSKASKEDEYIAKKRYDDAAPDYFLVGFDKTRNADLITHTRHKGNCNEAACAALAGLYANGFYNSNLAKLYYCAEMVNKKTGEIVGQQEKDLDHVFVLTDMGTGNKNIVLDPWLSFADSKSSAVGRYYRIYYDSEKLKTLDEDAESAFKRNMAARCIEYDKDDYYLKSGFVFRTKITHKTEELRKEAGYQFRKIYPEFLLNKTK